MKRRSVSIVVTMTLAVLIPASAFIAKASAQESESLKTYRSGVSVMNLLNGLNLSVDQQRRILALNKRMQGLKDSIRDSDEAKELASKAEKEMGNLYSYLLANPEQEDRAVQTKAQKAADALKEHIDKEMVKATPEVDRIVREIEATLSAQQLEVVKNFKSCIIPPKDLRDPVRAGQAQQSDAGIKALENARVAAKKGKLDETIERISERIIEHTLKKGNMFDSEIRAREAEIASVVKEAVKLNDTDFELKKAELAKRLEPAAKIEQLRKEIEMRSIKTNPFASSGNSKVKTFLGNPDIVVPILERRLQAQAPGGLKKSDEVAEMKWK